MTDEPDKFYWTSDERTEPCGCVFEEIDYMDGSGDPIWSGKSICESHMAHIQQRVRKRKARCKHRWRKIGPAPDYQGMSCTLWRCDRCTKGWELFNDAEPSTSPQSGASIVRDRS